MANELIPPILMTTASALSGLVYGWRRRSAGGKAALAAGCSVWSGTQVLIFMVPHTVVSTTMRLLGKTKAMSVVNTKIFGVEYDFRLYSLALVGIVFVL